MGLVWLVLSDPGKRYFSSSWHANSNMLFMTGAFECQWSLPLPTLQESCYMCSKFLLLTIHMGEVHYMQLHSACITHFG